MRCRKRLRWKRRGCAKGLRVCCGGSRRRGRVCVARRGWGGVHRFRRVERVGMRGGTGEDGCVCQGEGIWYSYGYISFEGLGGEPAEVLGDADTDGVLR